MHFKFNVQKKTQGVENIDDLTKADLDVLSTMLAEKEFMVGAEHAMMDMMLHSHLAQLFMIGAEYPFPLRDYVQESCKNLGGLVNRIKDKCWGDDWERWNTTPTSLSLSLLLKKRRRKSRKTRRM